jgi:hypothetical protein
MRRPDAGIISSEGFPFASLVVEIPQHFLAVPFVMQMAFLNRDADHVRPECRDALTTVVADAGIFATMRIGPLSTIDFVCMHCQLPYRVTRQQSTEQLSGCFKCEECRHSVHGWTGFEDFFDLHPIRMQPTRPWAKI